MMVCVWGGGGEVFAGARQAQHGLVHVAIQNLAEQKLPPSPNPSPQNGGYCGVPPPTCEPTAGCTVLSPSPPFWTNTSSLNFSFAGFASPQPESGARRGEREAGPGADKAKHRPTARAPGALAASGALRYRWSVGTTHYGRDVVDWVYLDGSNSVNASQVVQARRGGREGGAPAASPGQGWPREPAPGAAVGAGGQLVAGHAPPPARQYYRVPEPGFRASSSEAGEVPQRAQPLFCVAPFFSFEQIKGNTGWHPAPTPAPAAQRLHLRQPHCHNRGLQPACGVAAPGGPVLCDGAGVRARRWMWTGLAPAGGGGRPVGRPALPCLLITPYPPVHPHTHFPSPHPGLQ